VNGDAANVWDEVPDWGGGVGARRLVRAQSNTLGASVWELKAGSSQFVYHFHHGTEGSWCCAESRLCGCTTASGA
jgi:hypothetical protein